MSVEAMRATCIENGWTITPDDRVRRDIAAKLIDRAPKTLANTVGTDRHIPSVKRAGGAYYRLSDLSDYTARS
ncbi:hypothetical protein [Sphingomonas baiyangensis]|uniref:DNA-binding protein n=1 Tax=Sphingomonas baiyangensis TaxID=2572576 RepID=A0A4V5PU01_9SPHN|nr:hypothetical protein [Sphingomonas baiyangensis]TKD52058.1 hypothetical protein FBR43_15945 [Sphingomonas baiyangensis]